MAYRPAGSVRALAVRSPAYRMLLETRSAAEVLRVRRTSPRPVPTRYCISPYKTGTTYVAGLFDSSRSAHEPLHYTTLRRLGDVGFLQRRATFLDLELESSGFFAGHLCALRTFAPSAPVLHLIRPPEVWIGSVLSYFEKLSSRVRFNYVARLVFDPITHTRLDEFFRASPASQASAVSSLLRYWLRVYEEAAADAHSLIVPLDQVDDRLGEIESFLSLRATASARPWKRRNPSKRPLRVADHLDPAPLLARIEALGVSLGKD